MSFKSDECYVALSTDDLRSEHTLLEEDDVPLRRPSKRLSRLPSGIIIGQGLLNFILLIVLTFMVTRMKTKTVPSSNNCEVLYSPAQDAITYEVQFLTTKGQSKYMGEPGSAKLDEAWEDLYNYIGISQIHDSQAKFLPLPADSIPVAPEYHLIELSVFHELHCLNSLRKQLHMEYYPDLWPNGIDWEHVDHCVEVLRQSVMCSADISPMPWQWNKSMNKSMPNPDIPHSCKSWDHLMDWVHHNRIEERFSRFALSS